MSRKKCGKNGRTHTWRQVEDWELPLNNLLYVNGKLADNIKVQECTDCGRVALVFGADGNYEGGFAVLPKRLRIDMRIPERTMRKEGATN